MITEIYYWLYLAAGLTASFIIADKYRFPFFSLLSLCFLFLLLYCVNPANGESLPTKYGVILYLIAITAAAYYLPLRQKRKNASGRHTTTILILIVIGYLVYHKYVPEIILTIAGKPLTGETLIPLGVSYFSFKLIHYLVENHRGRLAPHTFFQFFNYIFLFPIYTAGPIERFDHFQKHWQPENRRRDFVEGTTRIIYGLIKKFLISDIVLTHLLNSHTGDTILTNIELISHYKVIAFLLISYLIIYLDFSAYSDIAIGSSRLLGFKIAENFNWPFLATNISMLWKRWHISLGSWCQAYVYMPTIGLTRNPYFAILLTFLAIGLWHGGTPSWVAWGLYQGIGVIAFVTWSRTKLRRRFSAKPHLVKKLVAIIFTNSWMAGSFAFTATYRDGSITDVKNALMILAKCLFLI